MMGDIWQFFLERFVVFWDKNWGVGDLYKIEVYNMKEFQFFVQKMYLSELFQDSFGYVVVKMIWRIVGIVYVEDLEFIFDLEKKVVCEW